MYGGIFQPAHFQAVQSIADNLPGRSEEVGVVYPNLQESTRL